MLFATWVSRSSGRNAARLAATNNRAAIATVARPAPIISRRSWPLICVVCVVSATRITRPPVGSGCTRAVAVASGGGGGGGAGAHGGGGGGGAGAHGGGGTSGPAVVSGLIAASP